MSEINFDWFDWFWDLEETEIQTQDETQKYIDLLEQNNIDNIIWIDKISDLKKGLSSIDSNSNQEFFNNFDLILSNYTFQEND